MPLTGPNGGPARQSTDSLGLSLSDPQNPKRSVPPGRPFFAQRQQRFADRFAALALIMWITLFQTVDHKCRKHSPYAGELPIYLYAAVNASADLTKNQKTGRFMNIHEYRQGSAGALYRARQCPMERRVMKAEDAKLLLGEMDGPLWVVQTQNPARGGADKGSFPGSPTQGEKGGVRALPIRLRALEEAENIVGRTRL